MENNNTTTQLLSLIPQAQDAERRYRRAMADAKVSNEEVGKLYVEWLALADQIAALADGYKLPRRRVA